MDERITSLLAQYGGPPVNIEAIIRGLGVELDKRAYLSTDISGELKKSGESYRISVNGLDSYFRQRFTMAHELGHYLLHRDRIGDGIVDDRAYRSTDPSKYKSTLIGQAEEAEANRFAARILMPADKVTAEAKDASSLSTLAERFQVSKLAMEIRLSTLGIALPNRD